MKVRKRTNPKGKKRKKWGGEGREKDKNVRKSENNRDSKLYCITVVIEIIMAI